MLIRLGYDIELEFTQSTTVVGVLNVHPSRRSELLEPDTITFSSSIPSESYSDSFGNLCTRMLGQPWTLELKNSRLLYDSGESVPVYLKAEYLPVDKLPTEVLQFLLSSRY